MRALLVALVTAALASAGAEASAEKAKCPDKPKAKRAFDAGHLAYRRGAYEESILKFQDSYELCEMALTLLAIANAYERLGDLEAALEHLEAYRPVADKRELGEIDSRIATLTARIEEEQQEAKRREQEEEQKQEAKRRQEEARRKAEAARAAEESSGRPLMWAGWISSGAGALAVVGGVVTGAMSLSLDGELSDACVDGRCPPGRGEDIDQLTALSTATDVLLVLGGTLTAAGITMVLVDSASDSSPAVGLTLAPGGASLRGSF